VRSAALLERRTQPSNHTNGVSGLAVQSIQRFIRYQLPPFQVGERILNFEHLCPGHRQVSAELAMAESAESLCDQTGRRATPQKAARRRVPEKSSLPRCRQQHVRCQVVRNSALQHPALQHWTSALPALQHFQHFSTSAPQIRSKFLSTSRLVSRNMTGRPCGQIVEYDVAASSARMCTIFS